MVCRHETELRAVIPLGELGLHHAVLHLGYAETVVTVEVVGRRQLEVEHVRLAGIGLVEQFLHQVVLQVARTLLHLRSVVAYHYVGGSAMRLHVDAARYIVVVVGQEGVARGARAQVAEMAECERRERGELVRTVVEIHVRRAFLVGAAVPHHSVALAYVRAAARGQHWLPCVESYGSAKRVGTIVERRRAEEHLHVLQHELVNGKAVLQMPAPVYKVVHPYAVDNEQYARRLEAPQYGAAPTLLALLHQHLPCFGQQVGSRLPVGVVDKVFRNAHYVLRRVYLACLFAVDRHYYFLQVDRPEYVQAVGNVSVHGRTACRQANRHNNIPHKNICVMIS